MANLRQEIARVYKKTPMYQLEVLMKEESKWSRKLTIAQNKLDYVRMKINKFAQQQTNINTGRKETSNGIVTIVENRSSDNGTGA